MERFSPKRDEPPLDDAYGRISGPDRLERFRALRSLMLEILAHLERDFKVRREEGYGLDWELERGHPLALASVRPTPSEPEAAHVTVAFTDSPGLNLRFGLWWMEPFPDCMCDVCDPRNSVEGLAEELAELMGDVTAGRFWESRNPRWTSREIWGKRAGRSRNFGPIDDWPSQSRLNWKPWPRRNQSTL